MDRPLHNFNNKRFLPQLLSILALCMAPVASKGQAIDNMPWSRCFSQLEIPEYPPTARQAAIQGSTKATVEIRDSRIRIIALTVSTPTLLGDAVRSALNRLIVTKTCEISTVTIEFDFRIAGEATAMHATGTTAFRPPGTFLIVVPPFEPQPEK